MPEGCEIKVITEQIYNEFKNTMLKRIKFLNNSKVYDDSKLFNSDYNLEYNEEEDYYYLIMNNEIPEIRSYGKKILFDYNDKFISCSLNIEGRFLLKYDNNISVIFEFENKNLYFKDIELRANISVINYDSKNCIKFSNELGVDLLRDDTTIDVFLNIFETTKSKRKLYDYIMDQKNMCGIGNYLRSEIFYDSKLRYNITVNELTLEDKIKLFESIKKIMELSSEKGGFTFKTYHDIYGNKGEYECKCFMKNKTLLNEKVEIILDTSGRKFYYVEF